MGQLEPATPGENSPQDRRFWLLAGATLVFILSRFIALDADPSIFKRIGDIGDEGTWALEARNYVLQGRLIVDELVPAFAFGPLHLGAVTAVFSLFGVSFATTRLLPSLAATGTILLVYAMLRKESRYRALTAAFLVSVCHPVFIYSRLGLVESEVSFLMMLTLYLIYFKRSFLLSGVAFSCAFAAKVTAIWLVPGFLVYMLMLVARSEAKWKDLLRWGAGASPLLLGYFAYTRRFHDLTAGVESYMRAGFSPYSLLRSYVERPKQLLHSAFFENPVTLIILVVFLVYLVKLKPWCAFNRNWRAYVCSLYPLDIAILCVGTGSFLAVCLLSDLADRRFNVLIPLFALIPVALLVPRHSAELAGSSPRHERWSFSLRFLPHVALGVYCSLLVSGSRMTKGGLAFGVALALSLIIVTLGHHRLVRQCVAVLSSGCVFAILYVATSPLIKQWSLSFGFSEKVLAVLAPTIAAALLGIGVVGLRFPRALIAAYALCGASLIAIDLSDPRYSLRDASRVVANYAGREDVVVGDYALPLSFGGLFYSVYWKPERNQFYPLNTQFIVETRPRFLLTTEYFLDTEFEDRHGYKLALSHYYPSATMTRVQEIELYPRARRSLVKLHLWEVHYPVTRG